MLAGRQNPRLICVLHSHTFKSMCQLHIKDRSLFKCQGEGRLKSRGGGHVNFHVASRGWVAINFDFPEGGVGGHVYIVPIK